MLVIAPFYLSSSEEVIQHTIERAVEKNIPVLTIGKQYDYPNCYCIMPDYRRQIEMITNHLIERHGIRKLNFLGGLRTTLPVTNVLRASLTHSKAITYR